MRKTLETIAQMALIVAIVGYDMKLAGEFLQWAAHFWKG